MASSNTNQDSFKALIVEDSTPFREILKEALCCRFPSTETADAEDGTDILRKIELFSPDIVLMDIRLPGENGLELTRKIKEVCPWIPVIILTNYDLPEYREAALRMGASAYFTKDCINWETIGLMVRNLRGIREMGSALSLRGRAGAAGQSRDSDIKGGSETPAPDERSGDGKTTEG